MLQFSHGQISGTNLPSGAFVQEPFSLRCITVLAQFIQNGGLERHIWKMKKLYNRKREHLLQELAKNFNDYHITGQAAGLHVVIHFHNVIFTEELIERVTALGVKIYPVSNYSLNHRAEHQREIIMGYAHLTFEKIMKGIEILRSLLS